MDKSDQIRLAVTAVVSFIVGLVIGFAIGQADLGGVFM